MAAYFRVTNGKHNCRTTFLFALLVLTLLVTEAQALPAEKTPARVNPPSQSSFDLRVFEEPLVATEESSGDEVKALSLAIAAYQKRQAPDDVSVLESYLVQHPNSPWRVALLTNLGLAYYHYGYFSRAISSWEQAWKEGRATNSLPAKLLVDRAVGELARMHARLGHADRIAQLIQEIGDRPLSGAATEALTGAKEGLWMMRNRPGVAFLCGPKALENLLLVNNVSRDKLHFLDEYESGPNGVSLGEVGRLATRADLRHRLVYRDGAQTVPMPAIVHWKVSHFAVLLGQANGRIHVEDPTFGQDLWITQKAFDSESSGYFLLPSEAVPEGFREITETESEHVRGMGFVGTIDPGDTQPSDTTTLPTNSCGGMCTYNIIEPAVSLNLKDTPVGYNPQRGPSAKVSIIYNQREAGQPANFSFFNVSPKWTTNWLTYVQDDPTLPGASVTRYVAGGGFETYFGYDSASGSFAREANTKSGALLVRSSGTPIRYDRLLPNGGREVYAQSDNSMAFPRRTFLSSIVDPQGNAVTLNYDSQLRLLSLTDATGRNTNFSYGLQSNPFLITEITDPFGRSAKLGYDSNRRLAQIIDVLGLSSTFTYDSGGLVNSMTTPYGTTLFGFGESTLNGPFRYIEIADPTGASERVEFLQGAPSIPYSESPTPVGIGVFDCCPGFPHGAFLDGRNTYYWDKSVLPIARGDYTKARIHHFLHDTASNFASVSGVLESVKYPLERRLWFNYPGQPLGGTGIQDVPSAIGRVLDDGTTQLTTISYNDFQKPTQITDPVGRVTRLFYSSDAIDLLGVSQQTAPGVFSNLATFTYNSQHRPLTYTDPAGQTTTYRYNNAGQLTELTDALGKVTKYTYDGVGSLLQITNANNQAVATFTYDLFGRVATFTDSEGYALKFGYDALDRITQITYPDSTTRKYTWDRLDLASVTDRTGRTTRYTYDAVRNLIEVTDPLDRHTKLSYYPNGHLKSLTDPAGNITTWNIDIQSRVTAKQYADGRQWVNTYEATTSRLKSISDPLGQTKQYTYTVDDLLAGISYLNSLNATPGVSFNYDSYFQRLVSMTDGSGTTQYQYGQIGAPGALKVSKEIGPFQNATIAYQYDPLGRVTGRMVDASSEGFSYDNIGRTIAHSTPLGMFTLGYLGQSKQLTSRALGSGPIRTRWIYDANVRDRRLRQILNAAQGRNFNLTTTNENLIAQVDILGSAATQSWTYSYDDSSRLMLASSSGSGRFSYSYDSSDNINAFQTPTINASATYNGVNQIESFNGSSFSYDADGNLINDGLRTYQWDAENRLMNVAFINDPNRQTNFRYDGFGRRVAISTSNDLQETRYLWCGNTLCQARNHDDVVTRRYYPEGELSRNGALYYAQDQLGSVRDLLGGQTGLSITSLDYDPYGNTLAVKGSVLPDFRYAGLFYEQNSGLYLGENREYDTRTGRWLSRDPLGEIAGTNLYSYVENSPINLVDPRGQQSWLAGLLLTLQIASSSLQGYAPELKPVFDVTKALAQTLAKSATEQETIEALQELAAAAESGAAATGGAEIGGAAGGGLSSLGTGLIGEIAAAAGEVAAVGAAFGVGYAIGTALNTYVIDPLLWGTEQNNNSPQNTAGASCSIAPGP